MLLDALGGGVAGCDLDRHRVAQHARCKCADVLRVSGREHEVLPLARQQLQDLADGGDEAHVEHAIGLIEHQAAHLGQIEQPLLREVEQPPRGGDQQIAATAQRLDLRLLAHATEDHERAQAHEAPVVLGAGGDLGRELARGRQHQRARRAAGRRCELLQDGQHEGGRLAGPGLGAGEHVTTGEDRRDRFALDGSGGGVALFGHGTQQLGGKPEIGK